MIRPMAMQLWVGGRGGGGGICWVSAPPPPFVGVELGVLPAAQKPVPALYISAPPPPPGPHCKDKACAARGMTEGSQLLGHSPCSAARSHWSPAGPWAALVELPVAAGDREECSASCRSDASSPSCLLLRKRTKRTVVHSLKNKCVGSAPPPPPSLGAVPPPARPRVTETDGEGGGRGRARDALERGKHSPFQVLDASHWKGGRNPPPPPRVPSLCPTTVPRTPSAGLNSVTDSNRPQPLWQRPPTALGPPPRSLSFQCIPGRGRGLQGAADAQTAHPATSSTAPAHQRLGSANADMTPAGAPAAAADRTQRPDATWEGKNG